MSDGIRSASGDEPELWFEDFTPGREFYLGTEIADEVDMLDFAERYDPQWFHSEPELAAESPWGGLIASGWYTGSLAMRMYYDRVLSRAAADASPGVEIRWLAAVRPGDRLTGRMTVLDAKDSSRGSHLGTVYFQWELLRDATPVVSVTGRGWFHRRPR